MPKIIATRGIQGSGKSTWAKKYLLTHPTFYRINGDDIRKMAYNSPWNPRLEKGIKTIQESSIKGLLLSGFCVIIDNMNLSNSAVTGIKKMAEETGAELRWQDFTDVSVDTCIENDAARGHKIGRAIIENTALRYGLVPWYSYRPLIIVDLDGTLFDCEWRRKLYLDGPKKDWNNFLGRCREDQPNAGVLKWVRSLQEDHDIVVVSGRNERHGRMSLDACELFGVKVKRAYFRGNEDHRHDWEVKRDILSHIPKDRIEFVIDDRPTVIEQVWRWAGVKVYPVGGYAHEW